jgi:protein SCO1
MGAVVRLKRKALLVLIAFVMAALVFGLPLLAVLCLGAERSDALGKWLNAHAQPRHDHSIGREVPNFSLTDQESRPVTRDSLKGRVWVASFFLSRCAGTCPMTSAKMASLQERIRDPGVILVSFSMDPENDTPAVLKEYASRFRADAARWHMLTGEHAQITSIVDGLGLAEGSGQQPKDMIHSDRFVLVDREGNTRGDYDSNDPAAMDHLAEDATELATAERDR